MPATSSSTAMPSIGAMSGMSTTFSINTRVTLWFTDWTTDTAAAYAFTLIFLFVLGIFNRFLGAIRSQLERRWEERVEVVSSEGKSSYRKRHVRQQPSRAKREEDAQEELQPLSPAPEAIGAQVEEKPSRHTARGFWVANAGWSARRDSIRALLEFIRAVIGYIL